MRELRCLVLIGLCFPSVLLAGGLSARPFSVQVSYTQVKPKAQLDTAALSGLGYSALSAGVSRKKDSAEVLFRYKPNRFSVDLGWAYLGKADVQLSLTPPIGRTEQQIAQEVGDAIKHTPTGDQVLLGVTYHHPVDTRTEFNIGVGAYRPLKDNPFKVTVNGNEYGTSAKQTKAWVHVGGAWKLKPNLAFVMNAERFDNTRSLDRVWGLEYRS
ncbi:hypothetical protein [Thiofilum flexile]|uniref:hypothetical protein n=1 Tax=Thiofilum flexile TaxID=125627 RepID=UPI00035FF8E3|nr:hypothetical protein [Thiofilum flexile]